MLVQLCRTAFLWSGVGRSKHQPLTSFISLPFLLAGQIAVNANYFYRGIILSVNYHHKWMNWFNVKLSANKNKVAPKIFCLRPGKVFRTVSDFILTFPFLAWIYYTCKLIWDNVFIKTYSTASSINYHFRPGIEANILRVSPCGHYRMWFRMSACDKYPLVFPIGCTRFYAFLKREAFHCWMEWSVRLSRVFSTVLLNTSVIPIEETRRRESTNLSRLIRVCRSTGNKNLD